MKKIKKNLINENSKHTFNGIMSASYVAVVEWSYSYIHNFFSL